MDNIDHFTTVQLCLPTSFCACLSLCATSWEKGGNESSNSRSNPASTLLHSADVTLYNHVSLVLPASVAYLLELIVGVIGNLLLFDFQYFFWHLLHHRIRWLYVTFHAIHHNYSSPCALSALYSVSRLVGAGHHRLLDHSKSYYFEMPPTHHMGIHVVACQCFY